MGKKRNVIPVRFIVSTFIHSESHHWICSAVRDCWSTSRWWQLWTCDDTCRCQGHNSTFEVLSAVWSVLWTQCLHLQWLRRLLAVIKPWKWRDQYYPKRRERFSKRHSAASLTAVIEMQIFQKNTDCCCVCVDGRFLNIAVSLEWQTKGNSRELVS